MGDQVTRVLTPSAQPPGGGQWTQANVAAGESVVTEVRKLGTRRPLNTSSQAS